MKIKIKSESAQTFIGVINALELRQKEKFNAWALGALDSLFFIRATLFPLDPKRCVEGLNQETIKALAALDQERSERFKQKVQACINQDEKLEEMYGELFSPTSEEGISPEEAVLRDLCYALEAYSKRNPNIWAEGALDALRWVLVSLFPFEVTPTDAMHPATIKTVQRVEREWQERFENELRKRCI